MTTKVKLNPFHRGDTKRFRVEITDKITGLPIDISGDDLWITLKVNADDPDPGAAQANATMPANADSVGGIGYVELSSTDTALLMPGQVYYYDLQWVQPGSPPVVSTVQYGTVKILQDQTIATA